MLSCFYEYSQIIEIDFKGLQIIFTNNLFALFQTQNKISKKLFSCYWQPFKPFIVRVLCVLRLQFVFQAVAKALKLSKKQSEFLLFPDGE